MWHLLISGHENRREYQEIFLLYFNRGHRKYYLYISKLNNQTEIIDERVKFFIRLSSFLYFIK